MAAKLQRHSSQQSRETQLQDHCDMRIILVSAQLHVKCLELGSALINSMTA